MAARFEFEKDSQVDSREAANDFGRVQNAAGEQHLNTDVFYQLGSKYIVRVRRQSATTILGYIAANMRAARLKRGMTQQTLSEKAGLKTGYLRKIEGARLDIHIDTLVALAKALEEKPAFFFQPAEFKPQKPGRPPSVKKEDSSTRSSTRPKHSAR